MDKYIQILDELIKITGSKRALNWFDEMDARIIEDALNDGETTGSQNVDDETISWKLCNKKSENIMDNDLIGKKVKLTREYATEYYYDYPYVDKVLTVVDVVLTYKEDDIKKEFGYYRVILIDNDGNIYDDDIEEWGIEEL